MSIRFFRPPEKNVVFDQADLSEKGSIYQQRSIQDLLPQIALRNNSAVNTQPEKFFFYQRLHVGRRCSCWEMETSPEGFCSTCFGIGIVGGFDKYGFKTEVIDVTRPGIRSVNIVPNPSIQSRPVRFSLAKQAVNGYLEVDIPLTSNQGVLDTLKADYSVRADLQVLLFVKAKGEASFTPLTNESLTARLGANTPNTLTFRVEMSRQTPTSARPELAHITFRYQTLPNPIVVADVPKTAESITMAELGFFESFSTRNQWMDNTLGVISTEDFFEQQDTQRTMPLSK